MPPRRVVSQSSYVDPAKVGKTMPAGTGLVHLGTVEAIWTCTSCGKSGIPGGTKQCPECGDNKGEDEVYVAPAPDAPFLTHDQMDVMGVDPIKHESDEVCPYCGGHIKPGSTQCPHCKGTINDPARVTRRCPNCGTETNGHKCANCGGETVLKTHPMPASEPAYTPLPATSRVLPFDWNHWWIPALVTFAIVLIAGLLIIFWPRQAKATVSAASWTCKINLQEYQKRSHENWSVPADGQVTGSEQRIYKYDKVYDRTVRECHDEDVQDGTIPESYWDRECDDVYVRTDTICYDDGTCDKEDIYREKCENVRKTRDVPKYKKVEKCENVDKFIDVPRYQPWYFYSTWEWVNIRSRSASGEGYSPSCPSAGSNQRVNGEPQYGFTVTFLVDDQSYLYHPQTVVEYQRYQPQTYWVVKRSGPLIVSTEPKE